MYVGNEAPQSSVSPIPQAVIDTQNAKMIPMANALTQAMRWPCFAPSPAYNPAQYGPAVVADSAIMQQLAASTAATSNAASEGTIQAVDAGDSGAPTLVPLNPYDFTNSTPVQTPKTIKSCPSPSVMRAAPGWGSANSVPMSSDGGMKTWLLVGLAALGLYGWSRVK